MKKLLLASSSQERLASFKSGLNGIISTAVIREKSLNARLNQLCEEIARVKPSALVLDLELFEAGGSYSVINLRQICEEIRTVVVCDESSESLEWELLKAGMRGICQIGSRPGQLNLVVEAVMQGELWISRTLTSRLIDELSVTSAMKSGASKATMNLLSKLTQREYDIAIRVGKGECNKQIALACNITERTVKAHLTEIFQKMGVSDRLNLALVLASDARLSAGNAPVSYSPAYVPASYTRLRQVAA